MEMPELFLYMYVWVHVSVVWIEADNLGIFKESNSTSIRAVYRRNLYVKY